MNILIFAGTIEGRQMAEFINAKGIKARVCVATEYGESLLPKGENLEISHERLDLEAMEQLMRENQYDLVIDSTHPYAAIVTQNIKTACEHTNRNYIRLLRESLEFEKDEQVVTVDSVTEAVEFLKGTSGRILATTGSKELALYTALPDYKERVYARVLSIPSVVASAGELGIVGEHLICMQGPFSKELNVAMMRQYQIAYMVTKESGKNGGFPEKVEAAKDAGATLIVVGRPLSEEGYSVEEVKSLIKEALGEAADDVSVKAHVAKEDCALALPEKKQNVALIGIGPGNKQMLTVEAKELIDRATLVIGAKRMTEGFVRDNQEVFHAYKPLDIKNYILEHEIHKNVVILLSGDVGFFSGAKKLLETLPMEVKVCPGISSLVCFFAKLGLPWEDVKPFSVHGKSENLIGQLKVYPKIFSIFGTSDGIANLSQKLVEYGMGDVKISVGEKLSYPDENITVGTAKEFVNLVTDPLCVAYLENEDAAHRVITHGLSDEEFLRDKVPMTKEEVRTVSISKLHLNETSVVYDIGAGTGSVSIELARILPAGKVFAIEKKKEAVDLLHKNKQKFAADQLEIIEGLAPDAMVDLPMPTHAFIGGSSGNLKEIVQLLQQKNPSTRVVVNAITLETVQEAVQVMKDFHVKDTEVVSMNVSKAREIGQYHLMTAQNPVYIFSFTLCE